MGTRRSVPRFQEAISGSSNGFMLISEPEICGSTLGVSSSFLLMGAVQPSHLCAAWGTLIHMSFKLGLGPFNMISDLGLVGPSVAWA